MNFFLYVAISLYICRIIAKMKSKSPMSKMIYLLAVSAALLTSCANSYNVEGSSSVSSLDGSKLYLKAVKDNELHSLDSCAVLHGEFHFSGILDTVRIATLFMDDEGLLPVVLEQGDIRIKIDNAGQKVSGTPLNEKLYEFIDKYKQLSNRMDELSHRQAQMMLDGVDENAINDTLMREAARINEAEDMLVTTFISDNFDNVLGPGVFMMITSGLRYPILTPQIEHIMSKATDKFKNDPYVKEYYRTASENEARMQGFDIPSEESDTVAQSSPASSMPGGGVSLPSDTVGYDKNNAIPIDRQ